MTSRELKEQLRQRDARINEQAARIKELEKQIEELKNLLVEKSKESKPPKEAANYSIARQMTTGNIGKRIGESGRLAGVVVNPHSGKCATAHDFRAAYLTHVAAEATQSETQALARHSDPKTTSQFYVRHEAEAPAKAAGWL